MAEQPDIELGEVTTSEPAEGPIAVNGTNHTNGVHETQTNSSGLVTVNILPAADANDSNTPVRIILSTNPSAAAPSTSRTPSVHRIQVHAFPDEQEWKFQLHENDHEANGVDDSPEEHHDANDARIPVLAHDHPLAIAPVRRYSVSRSGIPSTLRRLPTATHRTFSGLPDGVLSLILESMTSLELCVIARTDRRMADLTSRNGLWAVRCGFMQHPDMQMYTVHTALRSQINLKRRYLLYRQWRIAKIDRDYRAQTKTHRQKKMMCCLHYFDGPGFFFTIGALLLIGLVLTAKHIDHTNATEYLSAAAVWPYFAILAFGLVLTTCACLARCQHSWCHPSAFTEGHSNGVIRGLLHHMDHSDGQVVLSGILFLLVCLWSVMLLCKWCGWITFSYYYVFLPLFLVFLCLAFLFAHPITRRARLRQRFEVCAVSWCLLVGPLCALAVMACVRMEKGIVLSGSEEGNRGFTWMTTFIPLYLLNFYVCLASVIISVDERSLWAVGASICCWAPILAFEVLLANWLDHGALLGADSPRFIHVLIPLWIFMAICLIVACSICAFNRPATAKLAILTAPAPQRQPLML